MNSYEGKRQTRVFRLKEAAERAEKKAQATYETANNMAKAIPFGQPILIGHHSERSDRSYRDKIGGMYQKSFNEFDKASYLRDKAEAAETNTDISSDDPEAIKKLEDKLQILRKKQEIMKGVNSYYKKNGTCVGCNLITDVIAKAIDAKLNEQPGGDKKPFKSFELSNNNQNIQNVKKRIEALQQRGNIDYEDIKFNGGEIVFNKDINRIQFFFDEKPDEEIRKELKSRGFHFSAYNNNAWQRQINSNGIYAMKSVLQFLNNLK